MVVPPVIGEKVRCNPVRGDDKRPKWQPVGGEGVTLQRAQAKSRSGIRPSNTVDDLILDVVTPTSARISFNQNTSANGLGFTGSDGTITFNVTQNTTVGLVTPFTVFIGAKSAGYG